MYVGDFPFTTPAGPAAAASPAWPEIAGRRAAPDQAELTYDSALEPVRGFRGDPGQARVLIFTTTPLSLELEVMPGHVVGQIVPPGPGEIRVETAEGVTLTVEADDIGFFDLPHVPSGPVRLRCDTPVARLVTDWIRL